jgi:hypothetical protein
MSTTTTTERAMTTRERSEDAWHTAGELHEKAETLAALDPEVYGDLPAAVAVIKAYLELVA